MEVEIAEAVDTELSGERAARIERDAARIEELARSGFEGLAYEVFEIELYREAEPILLGMLRKGTLPRIARKQQEPGWKFRSSSSLEAPGARPTKTPCRARPRRAESPHD